MKDNATAEKLELVLRKINWAREILNSTQEQTNESNIADIISGVSFIMDSASEDAEAIYRSIG